MCAKFLVASTMAPSLRSYDYIQRSHSFEEVRLRLNGEDDAFKQRELGGVVAEILDMLKVDEEEPLPGPRR
jgi:hypothetical protein